MSYQLFIEIKTHQHGRCVRWILLTQANIAFEEHLIRFDSFEPESEFKTEILKLNPTGKVPALVDGDIVVWDSLSICEYVAEQNPEKALLPTDQKLRARARTIMLKCTAASKTYVISVR